MPPVESIEMIIPVQSITGQIKIKKNNEIEQDGEQNFVFNKVKGYSNKKWLIFPLDDLSKYQLKDRKFNSGKRNEN